MKSRVLALSAITSALVALVLCVGVFFEFTDLFALAISSAIVILPIYYKSYIGAFLSCLCGGFIALIFTGFNFFSIVFPAFIGFFGTYPITACFFRTKKISMAIYKALGLIWCTLAVFGIYFYYTLLMGLEINDMPQFIANNIYWFILLFSVVFYFIFDRYVLVARMFINKYVSRIISKDKWKRMMRE